MVSKIPPEVFLIIAALFWGGTFVAIKLALDSVPPFLFISIRFWIAGLAILLLYRKILFRREIWNLAYMIPAFLTAFAALAGYAFQTIGLVSTTATQSGFITGAYVIIVPLLQIIIEKKYPSFRIWASVIIVFCGLYFISHNDAKSWNDWNVNHISIGDIYTLAAAFFFAIYIILIDIYSRKMPTPILVSLEILFIALLSTLALPFEENLFVSFNSINLDFKFWIGVLYTAIFASILTSQIQARYQKAVSASRAGILYSMEPVFSFFFAYLILGESLSLFGAIGCFLVLSGIILSEIK
ncbi:MAG: DMT family transporter [Leptospira sp.]|nr:DMT family transporter [Leptospira sp.]